MAEFERALVAFLLLTGMSGCQAGPDEPDPAPSALDSLDMVHDLRLETELGPDSWAAWLWQSAEEGPDSEIVVRVDMEVTANSRGDSPFWFGIYSVAAWFDDETLTISTRAFPAVDYVAANELAQRGWRASYEFPSSSKNLAYQGFIAFSQEAIQVSIRNQNGNAAGISSVPPVMRGANAAFWETTRQDETTFRSSPEENAYLSNNHDPGLLAMWLAVDSVPPHTNLYWSDIAFSTSAGGQREVTYGTQADPSLAAPLNECILEGSVSEATSFCRSSAGLPELYDFVFPCEPKGTFEVKSNYSSTTRSTRWSPVVFGVPFSVCDAINTSVIR